MSLNFVGLIFFNYILGYGFTNNLFNRKLKVFNCWKFPFINSARNYFFLLVTVSFCYPFIFCLKSVWILIWPTLWLINHILLKAFWTFQHKNPSLFFFFFFSSLFSLFIKGERAITSNRSKKKKKKGNYYFHKVKLIFS